MNTFTACPAWGRSQQRAGVAKDRKEYNYQFLSISINPARGDEARKGVKALAFP